MGNGERTLSRNAIKKFILRVDLLNPDVHKIASIAEKMVVNFDRIEKRQVGAVKLKFTQELSEILQENAFDFVLISEENDLNLTFSEVQQAFWIDCNQYRDNSVYKKIIKDIINAIESISPEIECKRIGLRYINEYKCNDLKNISKIYGKRLATIIKQMANVSGQSRIVGVEEYNNDGYKLRFQYGIPNKFYPSVISTYDLIMDIDSFIESTNGINEWEEIIVKLNHAAYDKFTHEINEKYLRDLK